MTDRRSDPEVRAIHRRNGEAQSAERFAVGLAELRTFVAAHGHARVPTRYDTPGGYRLGQWCWWLRGRERLGKVPADRIAILDGLGFPWHPRDDDFARGLREINDGSLSSKRWAGIQRDLRAAGRLSTDRIAALDAAGFAWDAPDPFAERFAEGLAALDALIAAGSGPWVPSHFVAPDGFRLGCWLRDERQALRTGRRTKRQRQALRSRGVTASLHDDRITHGLGSLARFRGQHPTQVPASNQRDADGFGLGMWFTVRRRDVRDGRLDPVVGAAFAELGITLHERPRIDSHERQFETALEAYRAFVARTGRRYPSRGERMADGRDLSVWVMNLRLSIRLGRLPLDRLRAAQAAGLTFPESERRDNDQAFEEGVAALRAFVAANGHARVPRDVRMADGRLLSVWVSRIRRADRAGDLTLAQRMAARDAGLPTSRAIGRPARAVEVTGDHLGSRLHAFRVAKQIPLDDLAVALGVSTSTIQAIERRKPRGPIKLALVGRIADLLRLDRPTAARLGGWPADDVAAMFGVS